MAREDSKARLQGWKAIAAFFGRDERTVKRWEAARGLPVRRIPGGGRAAVWADAAELDQWIKGGHAEEAAAPERTAGVPRRLVWGAVAAGLVAAAGGGALWLARPPGREAASDAEAYAGDAAAEALYTRAVLAWNSRTPAGLSAAVRDLQELVRRRPDRAEGWAKLADCYLLLREFGVMREAEAYDRAQDAAERALNVDSASPGALRALAFVRFWGRADPTALELFRRALALRADPQTRHWYANALSARGRREEALAQFRLARAADPGNVALSADEAHARALAGDLEGARRDVERLLAIYPQSIALHRIAANVALRARDAAGYLRAAETEARLRGDGARLRALEPVRAAFSTGGWPLMLQALARAEIQAVPDGRGSAVMAAWYSALAGDLTEARRWLGRARHERDPGLVILPALPELAALASRGNSFSV